jgi:hypothetical protein
VSRGARKAAAVTLKIGKNAITAFAVKAVQLAFEKRLEIHVMLLDSASSDTPAPEPRI